MLYNAGMSESSEVPPSVGEPKTGGLTKEEEFDINQAIEAMRKRAYEVDTVEKEIAGADPTDRKAAEEVVEDRLVNLRQQIIAQTARDELDKKALLIPHIDNLPSASKLGPAVAKSESEKQGYDPLKLKKTWRQRIHDVFANIGDFFKDMFRGPKPMEPQAV